MLVPRYYNQRERFSDSPDVYTYDDFPAEFRVKVAYALQDMWKALDSVYDVRRGQPYELWENEIVRSLGVRQLPHRNHNDYFDNVDIPEFFIGVEAALKKGGDLKLGLEFPSHKEQVDLIVELTMDKLNTLLRYHGVGFEIQHVDDYPPFQVIRKDTEYTHRETVQPVLRLLAVPQFKHVDQQFRDAHREFMQEKYGDAITDAASSVESFLKVILSLSEGTLSDLLDEAGRQGYFPTYLEGAVGQWKNLLLAVGNVRNKWSDAHGRSGESLEKWEQERYARYALNLAAANILFLADECAHRG